MPITRRRFVQTSALAATAAYAAPGSRAARRAGWPSEDRCPTASARSSRSRARRRPSRTQERLGRIEKARRLMAEHDIGAIVLETGTSMTYFANVRWGLSERPFLLVIPAEGRAGLRLPRLRGGAGERDHDVHQGHPRLAGRRGLGRDGPGHSEGPRRVDRQDRRRGARPLLHRRRHRARGAGIEGRPGHTGDGRLPDDQVRHRDRADAARERHHHRSLQGRTLDDPRRHDPGRARREHPVRVQRTRIERLGDDRLRRVLRLPARQRHAAAAQTGRHRPHRRRLRGRGLPGRHHADDGASGSRPSGSPTSGTSSSRRRTRHSRPRRSARPANPSTPRRAR